MRPPPRSRAVDDLVLLAIAGTLLFFLLTTPDVFGHLAQWLRAQQLVDELTTFALIVVSGVAIFAWRRWQELRAVQRELRILSGVIRPGTRRAAGSRLEDYVRQESEADLSPDLCPDCERRLPAPGARRGFF